MLWYDRSYLGVITIDTVVTTNLVVMTELIHLVGMTEYCDYCEDAIDYRVNCDVESPLCLFSEFMNVR